MNNDYIKNLWNEILKNENEWKLLNNGYTIDTYNENTNGYLYHHKNTDTFLEVELINGQPITLNFIEGKNYRGFNHREN